MDRPKYVVSIATSVTLPRNLISHYRLICQLVDYEKELHARFLSPTPSHHSQSESAANEEWSRRRKLLDDDDGPDPNNYEMQREAEALDKEMEDRLARKSSS